MNESPKSPEQLLAEWLERCKQWGSTPSPTQTVMHDADTDFPPIGTVVIGVYNYSGDSPTFYSCRVVSITMTETGLSAEWSTGNHDDPQYWFEAPTISSIKK